MPAPHSRWWTRAFTGNSDSARSCSADVAASATGDPASHVSQLSHGSARCSPK